MVAKEAVVFVVCGRFWHTQRICEEGGRAVLTIVLEVIDLVRDGIKAEGNNAIFSGQNMEMQTNLVETHATRLTLRSQPISAKFKFIALKRHAANARAAHGKLLSNVSLAKANPQAQVTVAEESHWAKKACVKTSKVRMCGGSQGSAAVAGRASWKLSIGSSPAGDRWKVSFFAGIKENCGDSGNVRVARLGNRCCRRTHGSASSCSIVVSLLRINKEGVGQSGGGDENLTWLGGSQKC